MPQIGTPPQRRNTGPNPARTAGRGRDSVSPRRRAHSGSQGQTRREVRWRFNPRKKIPFSLYCMAGVDTQRRFAAGAEPHFFSLYSGLRPAKWARAFARKKAFGGRLRQAKRSACPTRRWAKPAPLAAQALSALRGDAAVEDERTNFGRTLL